MSFYTQESNDEDFGRLPYHSIKIVVYSLFLLDINYFFVFNMSQYTPLAKHKNKTLR